MSHSLAYRSKQNLQPCMNSISTKTSWPKVTKSFGSCYSALHEKSRTITVAISIIGLQATAVISLVIVTSPM